MMKLAPGLLAFSISSSLVLAAQAPPFLFNTVYSCADGRMLKVSGCTGSRDSDLCGVQHLTGSSSQITTRTSEYLKTLTDRLQSCQTQTNAQPVRNPGPPATSPRPDTAPAPQTGNGGFKAGDAVRTLTAEGWVEGTILQVRSNSYLVRIGNIEADKLYPYEIRRIGSLTPGDRAAGQYEVRDRVEILFEGRWVESEVIAMQQAGLRPEYQVHLPGNRTGWARPEEMRYIGAQAKPLAKPVDVKPGAPPKPGLTSCAGKIEGRYASAGFRSVYTIEFRSGNAVTDNGYGGRSEFECWTSGAKIYLHQPGGPGDMELTVKNRDVIVTPFGDITRKGN